MSGPEQTAADLADRDGRAEPAGTEAGTAPLAGPPAACPDPWQGYDLAILDAVLDA